MIALEVRSGADFMAISLGYELERTATWLFPEVKIYPGSIDILGDTGVSARRGAGVAARLFRGEDFRQG